MSFKGKTELFSFTTSAADVFARFSSLGIVQATVSGFGGGGGGGGGCGGENAPPDTPGPGGGAGGGSLLKSLDIEIDL